MNISDIAKKAGVSAATVSRAINGSGYVKAETRDKILEVIQDENFVINENARNLCMQESYSIGVMIPDVTNEFFATVLHGINEIVDQTGYNILLFNTDENREKEHQLLQNARGCRLKGLIITPVSALDETTGKILQQMEQSGTPIVLLDRDIRKYRFDGVFVDNLQAAFDAVSALIDGGHRRIGIITGPSDSMPGSDRFIGYQQALEKHGIPVEGELVAYGDFRMDMAYQQTKKLLSLPDPPTAIFTSNNLSTLGALKYLTEHDLVLGRDVSLLGFDSIDSLSCVGYPLSCVVRDAKEQGNAAMQMMLEKIQTHSAVSTMRRMFVSYHLHLTGTEVLPGHHG